MDKVDSLGILVEVPYRHTCEKRSQSFVRRSVHFHSHHTRCHK